MAIGSFMGRVFTVSHTKIFTPSNLKGSTGCDWATHEVVGGKARSEWVDRGVPAGGHCNFRL